MELVLRSSQENPAAPPQETIRGFFDTIAFRYDPINSLLSLGLDDVWRRKAVRLILDGGGKEKAILDLGVGTGKFLGRFLGSRPWQLAVGVDFSVEMLLRARRQLPASCRLIQADIHDLPFEKESFDCIVSSFTLRSVKDRPRFFKEVRRILRPGGKAAFLCLTRPSNFVMRKLHTLYLKLYLPFIGGMLSRDPKAYRFLSESVQTFPSPDEITAQLESEGFSRARIFPFSGGISTLLTAER